MVLSFKQKSLQGDSVIGYHIKKIISLLQNENAGFMNRQQLPQSEGTRLSPSLKLFKAMFATSCHQMSFCSYSFFKSVTDRIFGEFSTFAIILLKFYSII